MLASRRLDDQRFEDIVREARGRLPWLCPEWTDHNAHDPGITVMELMAWYKEMQQYHMDQVTPAVQRRLLALAGIDLLPASAARCAVRVDKSCPAQLELARLTDRQEVPFELLEPIPARRARLDRVLVETDGGRQDVSSMMSGGLSFSPFSFGGEAESSLLLGFGAVPEGSVRLWFQVDCPVRRTSAGPDTPPPRKLRWELAGRGEVSPVTDGTWSLSRSGFVVLPAEDWPQGEEGLYWLRVRLEEPGCEERVRLARVAAGLYEAAQQETRARTDRYRIEDRAGQRVTIGHALALWGELAVFLRRSSGWEQIRPEGDALGPEGRTLTIDGRGSAQDGADDLMVVCLDPVRLPDLLFDTRGRPGEELCLDLAGQQILEGELALICHTLERDGQIRPAQWRCVEDLSVCGPRDHVFQYDPDREAVRFGDGLHGAVPAAGKGSVLVSGLVLSRGGGGNVPASAQMVFAQGGWPAENGPASGGRAKETIPEARSRLLKKLGSTKKCLSARDFEDRARETPGLLVAAARALPGYAGPDRGAAWKEAVVTVVVLPVSEAPLPRPDGRFLQAVQRQLDRCRPVCIQARAAGPQYVPLSLSAQLWVENGTSRQEVERALQALLRPRQELIGAPVRQDDVTACLQRVPGVLQVRRIELQSMGAGGYRTRSGDIQLPPDGIPYWKEWRSELVRA